MMIKSLLTKTIPLALFLLLLTSSGVAQHHLLKKLEQQLEENPVFRQSFTGFALYDPSTKEFLYQKNADRYFTPASNTKLFTLFTCLNILGDTLPALYYEERDTALIFWGSANPSFLNPGLPVDTTVYAFLKNYPKPVYFTGFNFQDERYGAGWSWDDYNDYYQVEKSPFPVLGNTVRFIRNRENQGFYVEPAFFEKNVFLNNNLRGENASFRRKEDSNIFEYNAPALSGDYYIRTIPFKYSDDVLVNVLSSMLNRPVQLYTQAAPVGKAKIFYSGIPADSVYQRLMWVSDNFIAEQLLLMCSDRLYGVQNAERAIKFSKENLLQDLPDEPIWVDGSGLSRYNLFTPRTIVKLLEKLYYRLPPERLFTIFPAGGRSGTIARWYASPSGKPYVFAKTGTLSNTHCLSGYLVTKEGKVLIFSFMHNNFVVKGDDIRAEMQKILWTIYDQH